MTSADKPVSKTFTDAEWPLLTGRASRECWAALKKSSRETRKSTTLCNRKLLAPDYLLFTILSIFLFGLYIWFYYFSLMKASVCNLINWIEFWFEFLKTARPYHKKHPIAWICFFKHEWIPENKIPHLLFQFFLKKVKNTTNISPW